MLNLEISEFS